VSLIDPLAKMDLSPFWEVLCEEGIEKVVHAGSQDLEPVFRHMKCPPANVFDTQISCGFIGMSYPVARGKMVREIVGVRLGEGLAILRELVIWRDGAARAHDLPPRAFLKDEILLDLARNPVKSVDKLARIKGLPRPVELAHGGEMVEAIARAAAIPHAQLPTT